MSQKTDIAKTCELLTKSGSLAILTHKNPDGDTLGTAYALWHTLGRLGIRSKVISAREFPKRYSVIKEYYDLNADEDFTPDAVVSVDCAGISLLPQEAEPYRDNVLLAIDHHGTHKDFAEYLLLDAGRESCAGVLSGIIDELGVEWDDYTAKCLYTGLSTDTGCFRYTNTTAESLELAARLYRYNIDAARLNYLYFEEKSLSHLELEREALSEMELYLGGTIALMVLTKDMLARAGAKLNDIEGITPIPRQIEGVKVGITLRELDSGNWKGSLRTMGEPDAAEICRKLGGGGHPGAAGFECSGTLSDIKKLILAETAAAINS
ncbi:MAG: DHH family phosphoesterase [Oscillospiraceae bacterium]|nr:DHH family phosphoesterase [Oscillospiraceae bacterium]